VCSLSLTRSLCPLSFSLLSLSLSFFSHLTPSPSCWGGQVCNRFYIYVSILKEAWT
jgi:hypothetical protein